MFNGIIQPMKAFKLKLHNVKYREFLEFFKVNYNRLPIKRLEKHFDMWEDV